MNEKSRDVVAILPDAAIRVLLLDFEDLPAKAQESDAVVRFRLKKSLPFDVEEAALSCDVRRNHGSVQVVAAVSPKDVIMEYEAAFREFVTNAQLRGEQIIACGDDPGVQRRTAAQRVVRRAAHGH